MFHSIKRGLTVASVAATGMVISASAFAGDLADAVTAEIATAKAELLLVGAAVLGIAGVLLLIRSIKKSAN